VTPEIVVQIDQLPAPAVQVIEQEVAVTQITEETVVVVRELDLDVVQVLDMAAHVQVEVTEGSAVVQVTDATVVVQPQVTADVVVEVQVPGPTDSARTVRGLWPLAAVDTSGHRVVYASGAGEAAVANSTDMASAGRVLGLTLAFASQGEPVEYVAQGEVEEPSFAWNSGEPIYFDNIGRLTQARPTSGYIQQVAVALTATKIAVQLGVPVGIN
jgi:hypothetical protein